MRVAIVENDRCTLRSLEILLSDSGYDVVAFQHPRAAIDFLQRNAVDAIVLDYLMPDFNGKEVLEEIQDRLSSTCRVFMVTGYMEQIDQELLAQLGVVAFLPKPLNLDKLCQLIKIESQV